MKALLRAMVTVIALAAFTCPDDPHVMAIQLLPHAEHRYAETDDRQASITLLRAVYTVGDSSDIAALVIVGNDYRNPAYSAAARPTEFIFASSVPSVASIASPAILKALAPGESRIVVTHQGLMDTLRVVVMPRLSAVRVTVPTATIRAGDKATLALEASDIDARPVARVYGYLDTDQPAIVATREGSLTIQALAPGTARVSAHVIGQDIRAAATLTVTP